MKAIYFMRKFLFIITIILTLSSCEKNEYGLYTKGEGSLTGDIVSLKDGRINHLQGDVKLDYLIHGEDPILWQTNKLIVTLNDIELDPTSIPLTLTVEGLSWGPGNRYSTDGVVTPLIDGVAADDYKISRFQFRFGNTTDDNEIYFWCNGTRYIFNLYKGGKLPEIESYLLPITVYDLKSSTEEVIYEDVIEVDFGHIEGVDATVAIKGFRPYKDAVTMDYAATGFLHINYELYDYAAPIYDSDSQTDSEDPLLYFVNDCEITIVDDKPFIELTLWQSGEEVSRIVIGEQHK